MGCMSSPEMTERFGHMTLLSKTCTLGRRTMYRDSDSADGSAVTTGRPAWQKEGTGPPAVPAPANREPDTAKPAGPIAVRGAGAAGGKPARRLNRKALVAAALIAALGVGGWYGHYWWTAGRYLVSTDDAYVG